MWFVKLPWKLRTTMCFCHSIFIFKIIPIFKIIFIFEIILIFKIMIVIRFQIWFLIKFKLQRREWVWLKLGFSHAKELWHYKYRSQGMKKRRRQLERNPKNRETQKTITKNLKKKLKKIFTKKKKGAANHLLRPAAIPCLFFNI